VILAVAKGGVDVGPLEIAARQQSIEANVRPIIATFLAAVRRSPRRVVLILDDYHRARSPAVDVLLETLIEHGHPALHLVVSGRQQPTFHVSALSALIRGRLQKPHEVLRAATEVNAEILGQQGKLGVIAAGAYADLIVTRGNPLENLDVLQHQGRDITLIVKAGQVVKRLV
jgi:adenine deaminase